MDNDYNLAMERCFLDREIKKQLIEIQKREITEHNIYDKLAHTVKDSHNKEILRKISREELNHYHLWKKYTQTEVKPDILRIWKYYLMSLIFGLTFTLKLMNLNDKSAQHKYNNFGEEIVDIEKIIKDEIEHENHLINLIEEEKLRYISSIVLGLNDALVELSGTLAGFSLALQHPKIVAMAGLIMGISASLSLGASEYLAVKAEGSNKNPIKALIYTALTYIVVVMVLIIPFLVFKNIFISLAFMLISVILLISLFTYFVSVAQEIKFKKRFSEMVIVCLGVAFVSFSIGFLVKRFFNIKI